MSASDEARRLPAGSHGIPPDVVVRNQRERLVAAVAEACAERGYAEASVADIVHRAGVSSATFYRLFPGKRECVLEAHRELVGRLLEEVDAACAAADGWEAQVRAGVHTVLALLAADSPTAQLLTVGVMALGSAGVERNDSAIEAFAARLRAGREAGDGAAAANSDWARIAGISMLIGKRVMAGEAAALPQLEDELVALIGANQARNSP